MRAFLRSTLLLGNTLAVLALPQNQRRQEDQAEATAKTNVFQWQIYKACPDESRQAIKQAWEDSRRYGEAMAKWVPKGDYQPAMDMYMGDRSTFQSFGDPGFDFPKQIQDTIRRYNGLFDGKSEYGHAYLWVYCNEDSFWFKHCKEEETKATIAWETEDRFFNNWYITFCPAFFKSKWEVPLADVFQGIRDRNLDPTVMEHYYGPASQASTFFHESMHMSQLVTSPKAVDHAYGPELVYDLARSANTDRAVYNADSWTIAASAILAQQEFSLADPPIPFKYAPEGASVANDFNGTFLETVEVESDGNFVPEGAGDRAPDTPFYVDETLWEVVVRGAPSETEPEPTPTPVPEPAPEPQLDCHGVSGDYWVMDRNVAIDNVNAFCGQTEGTVTYNQGTVNELELSLQQDGSGKSPADAPDCIGSFTNAIDSCDGNDPVNNPSNYKFGSTFTTADGWAFTMTPKSKQVNEVNCDISYKFFLNHIEIRGKNWPSAKLGVDGQGLKDELAGCGAITEWKFETTPNDCCMQWYASLQLPIGTKACVGRAVESAGGSGPDDCTGAGKKRQEHSAIDDWPGYGDDSRHVFGSRAAVSKRQEHGAIDNWPGYGDDSKHLFGGGATISKRERTWEH